MMRSKLLSLLTLSLLALGPTVRADDDLEDLRQRAIKTAVQKVSPCVVMIETSGGVDVVRTGPPGPQGGGMIRTGVGPTTGVIVGRDGYIITSAFNFINKPSQIRVAIPGQKDRLVATVVATDQTRMLTLLKVEAKDLALPTMMPKAEIKIGHTALAVGRTLSKTIDEPPSVSEGIISALNRVWGKAVQTDAKVSPVNYGGPLVDLSGRVIGILVPASPRAEGETAGFEWYDSGIGFAVPLEDINKALPRLKEGKDLKRGLIGVNMAQSQDQFGVVPKVASIQPGSAAEKAGIKIDDVIKEIDGHPIANFAQLQHQLGSKYEGDIIRVKVTRGKEEKVIDKLVLGGAVTAFGQAFLGILPMRDDTATGVEIRYVYEKGPAEKAGLKEGDRVLKIGRSPGPGAPPQMVDVKNRDVLLAMMDQLAPNIELKVEVKRKATNKNETLTINTAAMTDAVPDRLPLPSSVKERKGKVEEKAPEKKDEAKKDDPKKDEAEKKDDPKKDDDKDLPETGLFERKSPAKDHSYWVYVPDNYKPEVAHALIVWLHPINKGRERDVKDFKRAWQDYCEDYHFIIVAPISDNPMTGWAPGEADFIQEAVKDVSKDYTVDKRRVIAHGMGMGGQMAFYLGFHSRNLIRGVATTGAALTSAPKERVANQPLSFFLVVGGKDPLKDEVIESNKKLMEYKFSTLFTEIKDMGHEYLDFDESTLKQLIRWIDSLDKV